MGDHPTDDHEKLPLHDEAKAREKWREGETFVGEGEDLGLPASEVDHAKVVKDGTDQDGRPGSGGPGTIPPPD